MVRKLYACLLLMHPRVFRRRFGDEMLCIFDDAAPSTGAFSLIVDGAVSLGRQWILRSGSWRLALAIVGACFQVTVGGLIWVALGHGASLHKKTSVPDPVALEHLMQFIVASLGGIVLMVATASLWMRSFVRARFRDLRLGR